MNEPENESVLTPKTKCIVVGGSPTLINAGYGTLIDSYETVVRVNMCHTHGTMRSITRKDLGTKTSIWCTSVNKRKQPNTSDYFLPETLEDNQVWFRMKQGRDDYTQLIENKFGKINASVLRNHTGHTSKIDTELRHVYGNNYIVTGVLAILNCIRLYGDVTILGHTLYLESNKSTTYPGKVTDEKLSDNCKPLIPILKRLHQEGKLVFINNDEKTLLFNS